MIEEMIITIESSVSSAGLAKIDPDDWPESAIAFSARVKISASIWSLSARV